MYGRQNLVICVITYVSLILFHLILLCYYMYRHKTCRYRLRIVLEHIILALLVIITVLINDNVINSISQPLLYFLSLLLVRNLIMIILKYLYQLPMLFLPRSMFKPLFIGKYIIMDKTGTATHVEPHEIKIIHISNCSTNALKHAIAIELTYSKGSLLIRKSFEKLQRKLKINVNHASINIKNVIFLRGKGLKAKMENHEYCIGNERILQDCVKTSRYTNVESIKFNSKNFCREIYIMEDGKICFVLLIKEKVKPYFYDFLTRFGSKTIIVTGGFSKDLNNIIPCNRVLACIGDLNPLDKAKLVQRYRGIPLIYSSIYIGDSINDIPAFSKAPLSITLSLNLIKHVDVYIDDLELFNVIPTFMLIYNLSTVLALVLLCILILVFHV